MSIWSLSPGQRWIIFFLCCSIHHLLTNADQSLYKMSTLRVWPVASSQCATLNAETTQRCMTYIMLKDRLRRQTVQVQWLEFERIGIATTSLLENQPIVVIVIVIVIDFVSGGGTRTYSVSMCSRYPIRQSVFFIPVCRLLAFNWLYWYIQPTVIIVFSVIAGFRLVDNWLTIVCLAVFTLFADQIAS